MISQESIQQIQSRIDIIDVISGFVKLKKRGVNYLGNCPFHHEKTPSFTVSPTKEIFKCFGCGKSGNAIGFLMEHEKFSFVEAIRWLAQKYNVELEETEVSSEFKAVQLTSDSLYVINQFARDFFSNQLLETEEGQQIALSYLKERGFREDIIQKFQLGYSPNKRDAFANAAIENQYNPELLAKTGIVVEREGKLVDNYRGRIIFPIHNQSGKVCGFGARIIQSNDRAPKYINTPENEIYVKSKILYGAYQARTAIDKANECLLVEGYTDVISLHQAGIENVVASGGTSLTIEQLRIIKKYTHQLTIIYDGDKAGINAALRGLGLALEEGLHVRLVLIPDGEDPDSYVHKVGTTEFLSFIQNSKKDFIIFQLEVALQSAGNDVNLKANVVNQIAESVSRLYQPEDFTRRQDYCKQISGILNIEEQGFINLVNKLIRERIQKEQQKNYREVIVPKPDEEDLNNTEDINSLLQKDQAQEQAVVRSILEFGHLPWDDDKTVASYIFHQMDSLELMDCIDDSQMQQILTHYRIWLDQGINPSAKNFLYEDNASLTEAVVKIMLDNNELSPNWKHHYEGHIPTREERYRDEVTSTLLYLQLKKIRKLIIENQNDLSKENKEEAILVIIQTHQHLKALEMELTKKLGTVILK